ncbi:MAG TPA: hypothetical protein VEA80_01100 [Vitreimonas sp.]|nr:hypothetical protein [Vitreimonas sp.]
MSIFDPAVIARAFGLGSQPDDIALDASFKPGAPQEDLERIRRLVGAPQLA